MWANHVSLTRLFHTGLLFEFYRASISDNFLAFTSQQSWILGSQISGCGQNHEPVGVTRFKSVGVTRNTNWWVWSELNQWVWPETWTSGCNLRHEPVGVVWDMNRVERLKEPLGGVSNARPLKGSAEWHLSSMRETYQTYIQQRHSLSIIVKPQRVHTNAEKLAVTCPLGSSHQNLQALYYESHDFRYGAKEQG